MPRSQSVEQYPDEYLDFTEKAGVGSEVSIVVPEVKRALSIRHQYYAFLNALRKKRIELEIEHKILGVPPEMQRYVDAAQLSFKVVCRVEPVGDGTARVVWLNRDNTWQAKLLATATFKAPDPLDVPMPASLAALAVKVGDK